MGWRVVCNEGGAGGQGSHDLSANQHAFNSEMGADNN